MDSAIERLPVKSNPTESRQTTWSVGFALDPFSSAASAQGKELLLWQISPQDVTLGQLCQPWSLLSAEEGL